MGKEQLVLRIETILSELTECLNGVSSESLVKAVALIESSTRIFVAGAGRSGLCMRAFGMRLMHLGKTVYVVGDTTTPSIAEHDLLILGSGSGRTASLLKIAETARHCGADVLLFTTDTTSPLAELSTLKVVIPAPSYMEADKPEKLTSTQPLGSLFEQSMFILNDSLIRELMLRMGVDTKQMLKRHANLE